MNELLLQDYFSGMPIKDIERAHNISNPTLYNHLKRAGLPRRKRIQKFPNRLDDFLSTIKTPIQAYFLGLVCSDGNIDKKSLKVRISLQESDRDILDYFSKEILGESAVLIKPPGKRSVSNSAWLVVSSKQLCRDLASRNIFPQKSLFCHPKVDDLDSSLFLAFLLGLFDGDGAIFTSSRTGRKDFLDFSIAVSPSFAFELADRLLKEYDLSIPIILKKCPNGSLAYLRTSNQKKIKQIYHILYSSSPVFLKRKKDVFKHILDKI